MTWKYAATEEGPHNWLDGRDVFTMIDWESDEWGNRVHLASNGSWVSDRHGDESSSPQE